MRWPVQALRIGVVGSWDGAGRGGVGESDCDHRLLSQDRTMIGGVDDVGIGALFGLVGWPEGCAGGAFLACMADCVCPGWLSAFGASFLAFAACIACVKMYPFVNM